VDPKVGLNLHGTTTQISLKNRPVKLNDNQRSLATTPKSFQISQMEENIFDRLIHQVASQALNKI